MHSDIGNAGASLPTPHRVEVKRGIAWWRAAWKLFTANPAEWVLLGLVTALGALFLALVPGLGAVVLPLLTPLFVARWTVAAQKASAGSVVCLLALSSGPVGAIRPLLTLGVLLLGAGALLTVMLQATGVGAFLAFSGFSSTPLPPLAGLVAALAALLLVVMLTMAFWFAPALVVLKHVRPWDAVVASFLGSLRNLGPFSAHAMVYFAASIVASALLGLGWVVLLPLLLLTTYTSCVDVSQANVALPLCLTPQGAGWAQPGPGGALKPDADAAA